MLLCCITLSSSRENQCMLKRQQEGFLAPLPGRLHLVKSRFDLPSTSHFWRRCRGDLRTSQDIPSTHHKLLSLALHYLTFASRFPLPHFTLAVLFTLFFFRSPLFRSLLVCLCVGLFAAMALPKSVDPHLRRLEEIENNVRSFMSLQFEHNNFFRNELKEQKVLWGT